MTAKSKSMEGLFTILFFSCAFFSLLTIPAAVDTIAATQSIRDGDTIVSAGETFELGFFSPGTSKYRYLGIWYKQISPVTVVWVANRETPLNDSSGVFKVTSEGTLLLVSGGDTLMWSSNTSYVRNMKPVAQILDTGNLVLRDERSTDPTNFFWQSFDYPGDTFLPGMKSGNDLVTGMERRITSWKSAEDPSAGQYVLWMDTNGFPQVFLSQGSTLYQRLGPWNGLRFSGMPSLRPNAIFTYEFVFNPEEIYFKYELINRSILSRMHLNPEGNLVRLNWVDRTQDWFLYMSATIDSCARYALCGPYGSCNNNNSPACSCIEGFEPKRPEEWNLADWSSGCRRKKPLECGNRDGFRKITKVKFPDTRRSWYNLSMTLRECKMACMMNCSCTAYANLDIRNGGSGCLLWFDDLIDVKEDDEVQTLFIRMAASELAVNKKKEVIKVVLSASFGLVLIVLTLVLYAWSKKKRSHMKRHSNLVQAFNGDYTNESQHEDAELPSFSLSKIVKSTNNFSINNKLGEGGFGPVYKGVLEEGREIAVKRLSKNSTQGFDEFKNEVRCIAKLQHRNLVKLLGYCIQGDEIVLIYEYMPNKSLDLFIFDETRSSMLDWPCRFRIIHGIARGLLYLHQDSRLRIIHRDLKAANILLDRDMNPKISDFGIARRFRGYETGANTNKVVGTYGYISPEYAVHGIFSVKSDVFSFGVLVLETVSGMKNRGFSCEQHRDNLLGHAWRLYKEDKSLELVSESLWESCIDSEVLRSIHIGLLCVQSLAEDRPTMTSVVVMLSNEGALPPPKQPAFFTEESFPESNSISSMPTPVSVNNVTITVLDPR